MRIGFIGCGNMVTAIVKGILSEGIVAAGDLIGSNSWVESAKRTAQSLGIETTTDNRKVAEESSIIVLGVKPDYYEEIICEIKDVVTTDHIIISITPGKTFEWFDEQFGKPVKLVRTMPNTPALVGAGMTGISYNNLINPDEKKEIEAIFSSFGSIEVVPEHLMDTFGTIGGSTPAFLFMVIEAISDAAVRAGMPRQVAYKIAAQAMIGTGEMVLKTGQHPGELKDAVCSPSGSTIVGVSVLEELRVRGAFMDAIKEAVAKAKTL